MPFIEIQVKTVEVQAMLQHMLARLGDLTPAMKIIGEIVTRSVKENFNAGGRPLTWSPLRSGQPSHLKGPQTMLFKSIHPTPSKDRVAIGTNIKYAAVHQFGIHQQVSIPAHERKVESRDVKMVLIKGKNKGKEKLLASGVGYVKAHSRMMDMPARPFLKVQEEDWSAIKEALMDYLLRKG